MQTHWSRTGPASIPQREGGSDVRRRWADGDDGLGRADDDVRLRRGGEPDDRGPRHGHHDRHLRCRRPSERHDGASRSGSATATIAAAARRPPDGRQTAAGEAFAIGGGALMIGTGGFLIVLGAVGLVAGGVLVVVTC